MSATEQRNTRRNRKATGGDAKFRSPDLRDGALLWRMAKDSGQLDLNSPYAYLMWCDQFADTSIVAEVDGWPAGFLIGFHPPSRDDVLFVWQVAVADEYRGHGLAGRMLDELVERVDANAVEATVTPTNTASQKLFRGLAKRRDCPCQEEPYITPEHFPEPGHEAETLFHIGPIPRDQ